MRRLGTLVGMVMWVLGVSPLLWAQGSGADHSHGVRSPATVEGARRGPGGAELSQAGRTACRLPGQAAARVQVRQAQERRHGPRIGALKKQQIPDMAKHFASQTPARGAVQNPQSAARARCCTKRATASPVCPDVSAVTCPMAWAPQRYPRLAGQPQAYIVQQLTDFKSGTRSNDRAHVMRARRRASHRRGDQSCRRVCRRAGVNVRRMTWPARLLAEILYLRRHVVD